MHKNGSDSIKTFQKNDMILLAICTLIIAIVFIFFRMDRQDGKKLIVKVDGKVVETHTLDQKLTQHVVFEDGENIFEIVDGQVNMQTADCPDQICVNHKPISKTGETIVCLPHKLVLEIVGGISEESIESSENRIDMISK